MVKGIGVVLLFVPLVAWPREPPPPPLACLQHYYGVRPVEQDGSWYGVLPGGDRVLYDYGEQRPFEERLRVPDLRDIFSLRYPRGPIRPVTDVDDDPGRIRHYPLLDAVYPPGQVARVKLFGQSVEVNRKIAPALERVARRLEKIAQSDKSILPFFHQLGQGYARRSISGTARESAHNYGIAIDLDPSLTNYWRWGRRASDPIVWKNRVPRAIVDAFEAEGFIWGGRWYHFDTGHFEYRPELLDARCYDVAR